MKPKYKPKKNRKIPPVGHPLTLLRNLRYVGDTGTTSPGAFGVAGVQVLRLNSIYDPDYTNSWGNAQPRGVDEYLADEDGRGLYSKYCVLGAYIEVTFVNLDTSYPVFVGIAVRDNTVGYSDPRDYQETAGSKYRLLGPLGSGRETCVLRMKWSAKKHFGVKDLNDGAAYKGTPTSNPSEVAYLHVWTSGLQVDTGNINTIPKIDFLTLFSEPVTPGGS